LKRLPSLAFLLLISLAPRLHGQTAQPQSIPLPTSKVLTAAAPGRVGFINSFPANIAISPDGRYAAVLNDGFGTEKSQGQQSIAILDLKTGKLQDFPDSRLGRKAHQTFFLGIAFGSDGRQLYASIGSITDPTGNRPGDLGNGIAVYAFANGTIQPERFIRVSLQTLGLGKKVASGLSKVPAGTATPYPAGLAVIPARPHDRLLVADDLSDNVILLDSGDGTILQNFDLSTSDSVPSSFPYGVVATRDGRRAWCSLWNASKVAELDLVSAQVKRWVSLLPPEPPTAPGSHPTALLLSPDEKLLYVALANRDALAVIDTLAGEVIHIASTNPARQEYAGSYPNALAQSGDGKRVFVADASLNAVAVFDASELSKPRPVAKPQQEALGFLPTDWYPSALAVAGDRLLVAAAKGQGTGANNKPSTLAEDRRRGDHPYIATLLYGSLSQLNFRNAEQDLPSLTRQVEENNLMLSDPGKVHFQSRPNPIRHVLYILKENRTYDQVLGDLKSNGMKVGNGDPSLTMYGSDITPNEHKLALEFGVLDNFYDSGEVSGDGHVWSNAAITSDYNEKTWQIDYRGTEHTFDYGGTVADELPLEMGISNVDAPGTGYIWDHLARHGVSYRDYGEFVAAVWCESPSTSAASARRGASSPFSQPCEKAAVSKGDPLPPNLGDPHGAASLWPWPVLLVKEVKPTLASLRGHFDPSFPDFNTLYPDQLRADEFLNEFEGFVSARKQGKGDELPAFVLLYLPNDHTNGTAPGKPRPAASVADNDLAVGRVVDAVSHSPYWDDTAIFIIEDDAQDGADHVDAHRSIAFVVSKYSPASADHPAVDSRFYTTVNMVHTMESLLGLPPMNQNDAYAPVMSPLFLGAGDHAPYSADWTNRDNGLIYQTNAANAPGAKPSAKMNFSRPDAINTARLNRILWRDRKGATPMPAPMHSVFPASKSRDDD
jgi:DNA-binding beta-propeller fold protein YncE